MYEEEAAFGKALVASMADLKLLPNGLRKLGNAQTPGQGQQEYVFLDLVQQGDQFQQHKAFYDDGHHHQHEVGQGDRKYRQLGVDTGVHCPQKRTNPTNHADRDKGNGQNCPYGSEKGRGGHTRGNAGRVKWDSCIKKSAVRITVEWLQSKFRALDSGPELFLIASRSSYILSRMAFFLVLYSSAEMYPPAASLSS